MTDLTRRETETTKNRRYNTSFNIPNRTTKERERKCKTRCPILMKQEERKKKNED